VPEGSPAGAWTPERAAIAAEEWTYTPPGGLRIETPQYLLVLLPGTWSQNFVYWIRVPPGELDRVIDEVIARARAEGALGFQWVVRSATSPADLGRRLLAHGFTVHVTAEVLYRPLDGARFFRPAPAGDGPAVVVREATSESEFLDFTRVNCAVFDVPPPAPELARRYLADNQARVAATGHSWRFVAYVGDVAAGVGGLEVAGEVGRLWGAGVLPQHRGRGLYLALLDARCQVAREAGATVALTTARVGSSGPILKRHGFRPAGDQVNYQLRWDEAAPHP
jgi:GNAT superfamily N-acetyltransferase